MLSGDYPFDGDTVAEINEKIGQGRFETPKNISMNAADLLDRMIEYRNDMRANFTQLLDHPWFLKPSDKPIDVNVVTNLKKYKSESFLKNTVMSLLVKQLSSADTRNMKEQFERFDVDHNGFLDYDELRNAFSQMDSNLSEEDFQGVLTQLDYDNNKKINYNEFLTATVDVNILVTKQKLNAIFQQFDQDGDG